MSLKLRLALLVAVAFCVSALLLSRGVDAANRGVQIRQVMAGANGNPAIQFVEMKMRDQFENRWANRVKLVFFDAAGVQTGEFIVPSNPPGGVNRSVLFATQAFANLNGSPTPNFIIPAGLLQPGSGKVCFRNTSEPGAEQVNLCLSYGSFSGDTEFAGPPAAALPTTGFTSLKRTDASASNFFFQNNADFVLATATPQNSDSPDLRITKFHNNTFVRGTTATYFIELRNEGFSTMPGPTTITDPLPSGLSFVSGTGIGWSCTANGGVVTCINSNPIAENATSNLSLMVAVSTGAPQEVTNVATVSNAVDKFAANNSSSDRTFIPVPDLRIFKSHNSDFVRGSQGTYSIGVSNFTQVAVPGATTVTDTLPVGLTFVSSTGTGWSCSAAGQTVTCTNPNTIEPFATSNLLITVAVDNAIPSEFTNTVTLSNSNDSDPSNNTSNDLTRIAAPNLSLFKTAVGTFIRGGQGNFRLDINNFGTAATSGVTTVTDTLPAGLTFVSASGANWSCSAIGQTVTCTNPVAIPTSFNASSIFLTVAIDPGAPASVTNNATISNASDSTPGNNTASVTVQMAVTELSMQKSHSGTFSRGSQGTYNFTVTNGGSLPSIGTLTVTDTLPAGLTFASSSGAGWSCSAAGQTVTCTNPNSVAPFSNSSFVITVNIANSASSVVINQATLAGGGDTNPSNNTASDFTGIVSPTPDLSIDKSHFGLFRRGAGNAYNIQVTNVGPSTITGTTKVTDTLPSGITFVSSQGIGWSCAEIAGSVICTSTNPIPPSSSTTVFLNVAIGASAPN